MLMRDFIYVYNNMYLYKYIFSIYIDTLIIHINLQKKISEYHILYVIYNILYVIIIIYYILSIII